MAIIDELKAKAKQQGTPESLFEVGLYYENEKEISEACNWSERAAKKDHTDSLFKLGYYFYRPEYANMFPGKFEEGRKNLKKASNKGHVQAPFHLGQLYEYVDAQCDKDEKYEEAAEWYAIAAKRGEKQAMYRYALFNEMKVWKWADIRQAEKYYKILADDFDDSLIAEHIYSRVYLGIMYCESHVPGIRRDAVEGKAYLEDGWTKAEEKGLQMTPDDYYRTGAIYCSGEVNPDKQSSVEDLTKGINYLDKVINDSGVKTPKKTPLAPLSELLEAQYNNIADKNTV